MGKWKSWHIVFLIYLLVLNLVVFGVLGFVLLTNYMVLPYESNPQSVAVAQPSPSSVTQPLQVPDNSIDQASDEPDVTVDAESDSVSPVEGDPTKPILIPSVEIPPLPLPSENQPTASQPTSDAALPELAETEAATSSNSPSAESIPNADPSNDNEPISIEETATSIEENAVEEPIAVVQAIETALPTATNTPLPTATSTPSATNTVTATDTATHTPSPTATSTATPLPTSTATDTATPTASPTDTATYTPSPTASPTDTATPLPTATNTATHTPSPSPTASPTNTATNTPNPTATPTDTATSLPTATNTATHTPSPRPTASPTDTATYTPNPTASPTNTPTHTPNPTATNTATHTPSPTASPTDTATHTPNPTASPTNTATHTPSPTATPTDTATLLPTATMTPTRTKRPSATSRPTSTSRLASTRTPEAIATSTASHTATSSATPTYTPTQTPSSTSTATPTNTFTPTPTPSATSTKTPRPTATSTPTKPSPTPLPSPTPTEQAIGPEPTAIAVANISSANEFALDSTRFSRAANNTVEITPLTNRSIALNWLPSNDIKAQYRIYSDMGTGYGVYVHKATLNQPSFIDNHLRSNFSYHYRVTRPEKNKPEAILAQIRASTFIEPTFGTSDGEVAVIPARIAAAPTSLPADAVLLGLISHNDFVDEFNTLTIIGELRNDSNLSVGQTDISITFYDATGAKIKITTGETILDVILPGERSPFIITLTRPQGYESYSIRAVARPVPAKKSTQLAVVELRRYEDEAGFFHVKGKIENVGNTVAKRTKVVASLFGRDKNIINVGFTYVNPPTLAPGEYADYDVVFSYYPKYVSQQVVAFEE